MTDWTVCVNGDKKRYDSRAAAQHAARAIENRYRGRRLRAYDCKYCHGFHLTSESK